MTLTDYAKNYCNRNNLKPTPVYSARRMERLCGSCDVSEVTPARLEQYRQLMQSDGYSAWTIKGAIKDIRTLIRASGRDVATPRVTVPQPEPEPTPLGDIDAIWPHLADWSRQLVVLSLWTALRLNDLLGLQLSAADRISLHWQASKTGKRFRWPEPKWMQPWLIARRCPYVAANDHAQVIVRAELARVSSLAGVNRIMPHNLRQRSITEWLRSDSIAGQLIHGCGMVSGPSAVLRHYMDQTAIIEAAASRLRLPACFQATRSESADILSAVSRLDREAKKMICDLAWKMAR